MGKMKRDIISEDAIDALCDLILIRNWSKDTKTDFLELLNADIESMTEVDSQKFRAALIELADKRFIRLKYSEVDLTGELRKYVKDAVNLRGIQYEKIEIALNGKKYAKKFLTDDLRYTIGRSEHEKTVDDALRKFTNSAVYILILAFLSILVDFINAFANLYSALH